VIADGFIITGNVYTLFHVVRQLKGYKTRWSKNISCSKRENYTLASVRWPIMRDKKIIFLKLFIFFRHVTIVTIVGNNFSSFSVQRIKAISI
jgi:hypothetical protein